MATKNILDQPASIFKNPTILERLNATTNSDNNKRRSRSHSPLPATKAWPQYNQDIRTAIKAGLSVPSREGPVSKWQGSGSPNKKGKDEDKSNEEDAMNDYSPIQSINGEGGAISETEDFPIRLISSEKMSKSSIGTHWTNLKFCSLGDLIPTLMTGGRM